MNDVVVVFGAPDIQKRGGQAVWNAVDQEVLGANLQALVGSLCESFAKLEAEVGSYSVEEIQVSVGVSASGKVGILGTGVEAEGSASLSVTFKKKA